MIYALVAKLKTYKFSSPQVGGELRKLLSTILHIGDSQGRLNSPIIENINMTNPNYKQVVAITFLLLLFIGCKRKDETYFEGMITYKISYTSNDNEPSLGDTMKVYYSKGNLLKEYNGKNLKGLKKEIFLGATNEYYMQHVASDTLFSYDISNNTLTLVGSKYAANNAQILGFDCNKVEHVQMMHPSELYIFFFSTYFYSTKALRINKTYFKNWKFGNFNTYTNEAGNFYLKCIGSHFKPGTTELITRTYEAVNIQEKQIDPTMFYVDTLKVKAFKM